MCRRVSDAVTDRPGHYDVVMANAVVHHLDDAEAETLFRLAGDSLATGGRMVSIDPVLVEGQHWLAGAMIRRDRGRFVQTPEGYLSRARRVFGEAAGFVRHDLLNVPYSHFIMTCSRPRER